MPETLLSTENLLHPRQVTELKEIKAQHEATLSAPPHIRSQIQDIGGVVNQIRAVDKVLEQAAKPIPADQIDDAVKLEGELRADWLKGMPTQAEMRKCPPGAPDKNRAWDARSKTKVLQWKHIRRRLHASGVSHHGLEDEGEVSNIEMYRPQGGSGEMSMDNAQISGKEFHLPPPGSGPAVIFSDDDLALIDSAYPELKASLMLMSNESRAAVLKVLRKSVPKRQGRPERKRTSKNVIAPLRARAKELGIKTYQMGIDAIRAAIKAKEAAQADGG